MKILYIYLIISLFSGFYAACKKNEIAEEFPILAGVNVIILFFAGFVISFISFPLIISITYQKIRIYFLKKENKKLRDRINFYNEKNKDTIIETKELIKNAKRQTSNKL